MEQIVTIITIGLIELVAALNILITLVMMVMEKYRDIAVLMSMGARRQQIRRIFMLQGVLIGVAGTAIGLAAGYTLCYLRRPVSAGSAWMRQVYALSYRAVRAALGGWRLGRGGGDPDQLSGDDLSRAKRHPARRRPKCCGTNEPARSAGRRGASRTRRRGDWYRRAAA